MTFDVPSIAAQAIDFLASETFDRVRRNGGSFIDGVWTSAPDTVTTGLSGSIQPMAGRSLQRTEAGRRHTVRIAVRTKAELRAGRKRTPGVSAQEADRIVWEGVEYEVEEVEPWNGRFYSATAVRVGDQ